MHTHPLAVNSGFTLIEVLVATAITALLLSAISLNLGVRTGLVKSLDNVRPSTVLSDRLDDIVHNNPQSALEALIGTAATANPFSDPVSAAERKLVVLTSVPVLTVMGAPTVIEISISLGDATLSRWLSPLGSP